MLTSLDHLPNTDLEATAETLQILAAVNPGEWPYLTQNDLDQRIERADLGSLVCRPTVPGSSQFGNYGNGKTTVVKAVLARLEVVDPGVFQELDNIHQNAPAPEQIRENLVFRHLEQLARQRQSRENREALTVIAQEVRPQDSGLDEVAPVAARRL